MIHVYPEPNLPQGGAYRIRYKLETSGCWTCVSHKPRKRDGLIQIRRGRQMALTRHIYEQERGEVPEGYNVLHTCDNTACINPDHLQARPFNYDRSYPDSFQREVAEYARTHSLGATARRFGVSHVTAKKYYQRHVKGEIE